MLVITHYLCLLDTRTRDDSCCTRRRIWTADVVCTASTKCKEN